MSALQVLEKDRLISLIENGEPIEISFPVFNSSIQDAIHLIVDEILRKYDKVDLKECVYTTLKELVCNGIKANVKHAVFNEYSIDTADEKSLQQGLRILRKMIAENNTDEIEKKARENNLYVTLNIIHSQERIIVIVENNTIITELEESRIREKFGKAMKYDSIADFYMDNLDDSEGQGIGITMIVLMLKGNHIDPHSFTIDVKSKEVTRAKIEFPISEATISR